jgi:hypothetical protein
MLVAWVQAYMLIPVFCANGKKAICQDHNPDMGYRQQVIFASMSLILTGAAFAGIRIPVAIL